MAVANYQAANGHYPPAYIADENGRPMHSWRVLILPYLEEQELYDKYDFNQPWNSEANSRLASEMPSVYAFDGEYTPGTVTTNYLAVVGEATMWPGPSHRTPDEVTDGLAKTILLVENAGENLHWMEPRDFQIDSMSLELNNPQGVSSKYLAPAVAMVDNTLRQLEDRLPPDVLRALLTANGGEPVTPTGDSWQLLSDGRLRDEASVSAESKE